MPSKYPEFRTVVIRTGVVIYAPTCEEDWTIRDMSDPNYYVTIETVPAYTDVQEVIRKAIDYAKGVHGDENSAEYAMVPGNTGIACLDNWAWEVIKL